MADFSWSWSDSVNATLRSCLPCFNRVSLPNDDAAGLNTAIQPRRARSNELEELLADVLRTDSEVDEMSLHSNPGSARFRQRRRNRKTTSFTMCGYSLFGKQPIRLEEDSDEGGDEMWRRRGRRSKHAALDGVSTAPSSSTFDSDAAMLDPETIHGRATSSEIDRQLLLAAEEQRQKHERRVRRREKKERQRVEQTLAAQSYTSEGFQASGGDLYHAPYADDDEADLDGSVYTRTASGSSNGTDSRSRTSESYSQSAAPPPLFPPRLIISPRFDPAICKTPKKSESSSSTGSSDKSRSSASTSTAQSLSVASPVNTEFPPNVVLVSAAMAADNINRDGSVVDAVDASPRLGQFPGGTVEISHFTDKANI